MYQLIRMVSRAFQAPSAPDPSSDGFSEDAVREIVSARSHGNLRLQWGQYYTQKDVDDRYAAIRDFDFAN